MTKIFVFVLLSFLFSQDEPFEGYTLFDPMGNNESYLMDIDYNIIHTWQSVCQPSSMPYLMPDSSLIRPGKIEDPVMLAGGAGGLIQKIDWDSSVLWSCTYSDSDYQQHHDIQPMPNGNILLLLWERKTHAEALAVGRQNVDNDMWPTAIVEIEPVGTTDVNVIWEWHLWDHLTQDVDSELPNYGVVSEHPELLNINYGEIGGGLHPDSGDWIHCNAIDYNPQLDQIAICSRKTNELYIIDHSTTTAEAAGHSGGQSGKGGDFLYRWGNPQVYDRGSESDRKLFAPHGVNWISPGYPGEGHLMIFNNGSGRPDGDYSTVEELIPPIDADGNYFLNEGNIYLPDDPIIIFGGPGNFYANRQSGAYRLQNGNTFICAAYASRLFELSPNGEIVWEYFHPGDLVVARALRYGMDYLTSGIPTGDMNNDEVVDILDIVIAINIIMGINEPTEYQQFVGDLNEDGVIDILDIIRLVNVIIGITG